MTTVGTRPVLPSPLQLTMTVIVMTGGFHALGRLQRVAVDWSDPGAWLATTPPETVLVAGLRLIGLAVCYWVLATAALYWLSRRRGMTPAWVRFMTMPVLRRVIDRAFATGLTVSIAFTSVSPATAVEEEPAPVIFEVHDGVPLPHVHIIADGADTAAPPPAVTSVPAFPPRAVPAISNRRTAPTAVVADRHTVVPGDNLWDVAAHRLEAAGNGGPTTAEITTYWQRLVEANQASLRSGDPNLIFPGEILTIPPASADR